MRVVSGLVIFAVAILLAGCGQKGPLYLPSPEQSSQEPTSPAQPEQAPSTSPAVEQET
ncbi:lipoprotein [Vreelandella rituensis]|nr:lipoprotein [Halomonas rituensis]